MSRLPAKGFSELVRGYSGIGSLQLVEKALKGVCTVGQGFFILGRYLVNGLGVVSISNYSMEVNSIPFGKHL